MKTRKLKKQKMPSEEDFVSSYHREVVEFHPHCYMQPLALAEAKRFEEIYALAHSATRSKNAE